MKQINMFGEEFEKKEESTYTSKIKIPLYEPKNKKPHILELCDKEKANRLIREINNSNLSVDEKDFLINAAKRHNVFNYEKIADYYSHSSKEMQIFMERSALVIIDFDKAYSFGYINLAQEIANQYFENYGD
jgi:hypothetical protein